MDENSTSSSINKKTLTEDLISLGVKKGDLLYVKVSMRSLGRVDGGADTFIDAVLDVIGKEGTMVVSSFVKVKPLSYLKRHKNFIYDIHTPSYAGAVVNAMMKYPNVVMSRHPVQKFSAIGKLAEKLMNGHTEGSYAYDPLRIMAETGGKCLVVGEHIAGVGTTHVAVGLLGFKQKRPNVGVRYKNDKNEVKLFQLNWAGMCSEGFGKFEPEYEKSPGAIISKGTIGNAASKLTDMKKTLEIELKILDKDPGFFLCKGKECFCCQLSWEFSKGKPVPFFIRSLLTFNYSNLKLFFGHYIRGAYQPAEDCNDLLFMGKSYCRKASR